MCGRHFLPGYEVELRGVQVRHDLTGQPGPVGHVVVYREHRQRVSCAGAWDDCGDHGAHVRRGGNVLECDDPVVTPTPTLRVILHVVA